MDSPIGCMHSSMKWRSRERYGGRRRDVRQRGGRRRSVVEAAAATTPMACAPPRPPSADRGCAVGHRAAARIHACHGRECVGGRCCSKRDAGEAMLWGSGDLHGCSKQRAWCVVRAVRSGVWCQCFLNNTAQPSQTSAAHALHTGGRLELPRTARRH